MNQVSFHAFALRVPMSSPGGVNHNPVGGPSGACGPSVCTSKKARRKPRPVDQLPLPLAGAPIEVHDNPLFWHGEHAGNMKPGFHDPFGDYVNPMDAPCRLPMGGLWSHGARAFGGVPRDWLQ